MAIEDLRFACERGGPSGWRQYDSIECLVRDPGPGAVWLADYDSRALSPAESVWVVHGDFPSPMGAGLAAFRDRVAAADIAARTRGRVARLEAWAAAETRR
jgi:nitrous oxide reductase accessory protein NosL